MLREGPLQRCPLCGQVYKLVRLRKEESSENEYYTSGLLDTEYQELIDDDHVHHASYYRLMPDQYEHTSLASQSDTAFISVNADQHDKMLVDPAFRIEKQTEAHKKVAMFERSLEILGKKKATRYDDIMGRTSISKDIYNVLIDSELAIAKLDRATMRHRKFQARQFLDLDNHDRRERRMLQRSKARVEDSYTAYFGGMSELELQYADYFETDLDGE